MLSATANNSNENTIVGTWERRRADDPIQIAMASFPLSDYLHSEAPITFFDDDWDEYEDRPGGIVSEHADVDWLIGVIWTRCGSTDSCHGLLDFSIESTGSHRP